MFKVNNRNTRPRCEICSKLTIKTSERRYWRRSSVSVVNFEQVNGGWMKVPVSTHLKPFKKILIVVDAIFCIFLFKSLTSFLDMYLSKVKNKGNVLTTMGIVITSLLLILSKFMHTGILTKVRWTLTKRTRKQFVKVIWNQNNVNRTILESRFQS